jgi:hypothetical protein
VTRGRNKGKTRDAIYRARHRGVSTAVRQRVTDVAKQLVIRSFHDPARSKLLETRKAIVRGWLRIADSRDLQGEVILAGYVRNFARRLPPVLTGREPIAVRFAQELRARQVDRLTGGAKTSSGPGEQKDVGRKRIDAADC